MHNYVLFAVKYKTKNHFLQEIYLVSYDEGLIDLLAFIALLVSIQNSSEISGALNHYQPYERLLHKNYYYFINLYIDHLLLHKR